MEKDDLMYFNDEKCVKMVDVMSKFEIKCCVIVRVMIYMNEEILVCIYVGKIVKGDVLVVV